MNAHSKSIRAEIIHIAKTQTGHIYARAMLALQILVLGAQMWMNANRKIYVVLMAYAQTQ